MRRMVVWVFVAAVAVARAKDAGVESVFSPGAGGRLAALAGAGAASEADVAVMVHNPAGLATLTAAEVQSAYFPYPYGTTYLATVFGYPIPRVGVLGVGVLHLGTDGIVFTDEQNIVVAMNRSYSRSLLTAAYAGDILETPLALGAMARLELVRLADRVDGGFSVDFGLRANAWGERWRRWFGRYEVEGLVFGCSVREVLGTGTRLGSVTEPAAWLVKTGIAYRFRPAAGHLLQGFADLDIHRSKGVKPSVALEYTLFDRYFLRAGMGAEAGPSLGGGMGWTPARGHRLRFDYALGFPAVGPVHRLAAVYNFGETVEERLSAEEARRLEEFNRRVSEALAEERKATEERLRRMRAELEREQETNRRAELEREIRRVMEEERNAAERRVRELQEAYSRDMTNMSRTFRQELEGRVESVRRQAEQERQRVLQQAAQERQRALQEERAQAQRRAREAREEQARLGRELLRAQTLLYDAEDFDGAVAVLQEILQRDPENEEAKLMLARARNGRLPVSSYPAEVQEAINRGMNLLVKENKREEAIRVWEEALAKHPDNWRLYKLIRDAKRGGRGAR